MSSVGWFPWEELPVIELTSHSVLDSITFSIDNSDHDHSDALGVEYRNRRLFFFATGTDWRIKARWKR